MNKNNQNNIVAKPFLKWAGGKTQLLSQIEQFYPATIEKYCEPFIGGGAVLFDIVSKFNPKEILINDINPELTNCYIQIKKDPKELLKFLTKLEKEYLSANGDRRKEIYFKKRDKFNKLIESKVNTIEKAALMIYLNRTCFNGLYRVNSKGLFNVPSGVYKNPTICDEENINAVHKALKNVKILTGDYKKTESFIDKNTFVYIDPPYRPLTDSASFTSYSKESFTDKEQIELSNFINSLRKKRAKILLSNSDPKNVNKNDNFFDDLYNSYEIHRVVANRMINSNAVGRGKITELLVGCS